jgi:glycosyltransferase involved in cell wall biosynthesis
MKILCIHHRLGGFGSHHFNECVGLAREFARRGRKFLLWINRQAPTHIAEALNARAELDDPTFRMEWSFEERTRRFVAMLHAHLDGSVDAGDCVMVTIATQLEVHALTKWLQELPSGRQPWIVILMVSDRWNRSDRAEYDRQCAEFQIVKRTLARLARPDAHRIIIFTLTELLAEELTGLLGVDVKVAPIPLDYGVPPPHVPARIESRPPRVSVLGGTRREKGSHLVPDIVAACRARVEVEFLVQLANDNLTAAESDTMARIAAAPGVTVIPEAVHPSAYYDALTSADLALFPYQVVPYRKRTSGVFAEAVAFAKPVVATAGTWMAAQIGAGRAAGTVIADLEADSAAQAIASCVADLPALERSAAALSVQWRATEGMPAFVSLIAQEIERRSAL